MYYYSYYLLVGGTYTVHRLRQSGLWEKNRKCRLYKNLCRSRRGPLYRPYNRLDFWPSLLTAVHVPAGLSIVGTLCAMSSCLTWTQAICRPVKLTYGGWRPHGPRAVLIGPERFPECSCDMTAINFKTAHMVLMGVHMYRPLKDSTISWVRVRYY